MTSAIRSFAALLGGSRRILAVSTGLSIAQSLMIVPIGLLLRRVFDHTIPGEDKQELVVIGGLVVILALAAAALALWTRHLVLAATKRAVLKLRVSLFERLQQLPASWADRQEAGRLHATIVQDTERLDNMLCAAAAQVVPSAIVALALSATMIVLDPVLFALLVPAVPVMMLVTRRLGRTLAGRTLTWQEDFDRFSMRTSFLLRARRLIRVHGTEKIELAAARKELEDVRDSGRVMAWMGASYVQAGAVIAMTAAVVVLVVGGAAVVDGRTSLGSLISFYALAAMLRGHVSTVVAIVPEVISGRASLVRLEALLATDEPEPYTGTRVPTAVLPVVVDDVHFGYAPERPVLLGATLEIRAGDVVGIVGANGAGKSTIAALVLGLYRPARGSIVLAGLPLDTLDVRAVRRRIAVVAQDPVLFAGTIGENIAYGEPEADRARIEEAARLAAADTFISALPLGYDTQVGDEGGLLSGGQRQRIAIARAMLRAPELLILDEPTAGLDEMSVDALLTTIGQLSRDRAVVLISHDGAVVDKAADRAYLLEGGVIAPQPRAYGTAVSGRAEPR